MIATAAEKALAGVGRPGEEHEWVLWTESALHVKRLLTDEERNALPGTHAWLVDVRGMNVMERADWVERLIQEFPVAMRFRIRRMASAEMAGGWAGGLFLLPGGS